VDDVATALDDLRAEGARLIDEAPRAGSRNTLIAFVHPKAMGGVLVELVQERRAG
jgi:methylmalonyl-CoA/ethylmalonyl-CoA epimerase